MCTCTAHEYARTRTRGCQYGWTKSANLRNIKTFQCDGDLVLYKGGGGGGSGRSTHSPESDPNARGRVRGIALHALCSNEESSHILAGTNCDATEPSLLISILRSKIAMQFLRRKLFPVWICMCASVCVCVCVCACV